MKKHHLIYFENKLGTTKSRSGFYRKLLNQSPVRKSNDAFERVKLGDHGVSEEQRLSSSSERDIKASLSAETLIEPRSLVSTWVNSAVNRLAPLSIEPNATGNPRRHSEPAVSCFEIAKSPQELSEKGNISDTYNANPEQITEEEAIDAKARGLWTYMLDNMAASCERMNYSCLVDVVNESKRMAWFQDALGYLCVLQGLKDISADTIYRNLFRELRSLLLFMQTADFRSIPLRRLRKASSFYIENIQVLPITVVILEEYRKESMLLGTKPYSKINNKSLSVDVTLTSFPPSVQSIMRWIISFQMLIEMRLLAVNRKKYLTLINKHGEESGIFNTSSNYESQLPSKSRQYLAGALEEWSLISAPSRYLLSCDELIRMK